MAHPAKMDGIYYPSRHHGAEHNLAIFNQRNWQRVQFDDSLVLGNHNRQIDPKEPIVHGPAVLLRDHPELQNTLILLEVATLP